MTFRPRFVQWTTVCCLIVPATVLADGGLHPRTTTRLLSAFRELASDASPAPADISTSIEASEAAGDGSSPSSDHVGAAGSEVQQVTVLRKATFGTGCFWCTEAVFEEMHGVKNVISGYSGGQVPFPSYQQVLTGLTGHAEVVQIHFDPRQVSYAGLLEAFWFAHDPTTLNRQGVDVGTQYRSVVFYHTNEQRELAERYRSKLDGCKAFRNPIVTAISKFQTFYPAEKYHQDYFELNGRKPYCRAHIRPKVQKFRRIFRESLKGQEAQPSESDGR
jgi:peptide-methionine (S)-S-oxide reductase